MDIKDLQKQALVKKQKELQKTEYVPYERPIAEAVSRLMDLTKQAGYSQVVDSEKHWEVIEMIYKLWTVMYPDQVEAFYEKQKEQKKNQKNEFASNREGEAQVRHLVEIPMKFYQLIQAVFPQQKFDKKFSIKLGQRLPALRWSEKI